MHNFNSLNILKRGIILFWAVWFSLATLTNFFDLLKYYHGVSEGWKFVSNNLSLISNVISIYGLSPAASSFFLMGAICLEGIITLLFWIAAFSATQMTPKKSCWVNGAFTLSTFLWALFLVMDEFFIAYPFENTHLPLLVSQLICLLAIHLLPDTQSK